MYPYNNSSFVYIALLCYVFVLFFFLDKQKIMSVVSYYHSCPPCTCKKLYLSNPPHNIAWYLFFSTDFIRNTCA